MFTDIQGSTPIWERDPTVMKAALAQHHAVLRALIARHGGYEVETAGDSFMIAFSYAPAAIAWCLDAQAALLAADWPASLLPHPEAAEILDTEGRLLFRGLRVRMGVHVGPVDTQVDPATGRMHYYGPTVNRAARIEQAAHGGQVLASREAWSMAQGLAGTEMEDLGDVRMKGLSGTVGLVQVHPVHGPRRRFPPPRAEGGLRTNLTPARTSFIGRAAEIARIVAAFRAGERLVTLVGPGGAGKTRLARAASAEMGEEHPGGVWLVELAPVRTKEMLVEVVAGVLTIPLRADVTLDKHIKTVGDALAARGRVLLVLDNLEHLVELARDIVSCWLDAAPSLQILATSQHRLSIVGEHLHEVGGLPTDEAVALFVERARRVRPSFALRDGDETIIREIVRRLEGQPLAIELAAARVGLLSLRALNDRLRERFNVLTTSQRDAPRRQSTLRATLEWSWSLLAPCEQAAMSQLAKMPSGFDAETAEAIVGLSAFRDAPSTLEVVQSLLDKSMLRSWEPPELPGETRLAPYESVRAFALEHPAEIGVKLVTWAVHHGEKLLADWKAAPKARLLRRLRLEAENYRAALQHAIGSNVEVALRLYDVIDCVLGDDPGMTSSTFRLVLDDAMLDRLVEATANSPSWHLRSLYHRCRRRIIFRPRDLEGAERDITEMEQLGGAGHLKLRSRSRLARARYQWSEALAYAQRAHDMAPHDDLEWQFHSLAWLCDLAHTVGLAGAEHAYVEDLLRKSTLLRHTRPLALRALGRSMSPRPGGIKANGQLWSNSALETPEHRQEAISAYSEAIRCAHDYGLRDFEDQLVGELGGAVMYAGRWDEADAHFKAALSRTEQRGDHVEFARNLIQLGRLEYMRHRDQKARGWLERAARMMDVAPEAAFGAEIKLTYLDLATGMPIGDRLKTLVEKHKATQPRVGLDLREAHAFLAATSGDPEAVCVVLAQGDQLTAMFSDKNLETALVDVAHARKSLAKGESSAAEGSLNAARVRLQAAYPNDDLPRLVERAIADLEHEMSSKN